MGDDELRCTCDLRGGRLLAEHAMTCARWGKSAREAVSEAVARAGGAVLDPGDDLARMIEHVVGGFGGARERNYDGQLHMFTGVRGMHTVIDGGRKRGWTMRDIGDCIARGISASRLSDGTSDPTVVVMNSLVEIEKMLGIFPNVPHLRSDDAEKV